MALLTPILQAIGLFVATNIDDIIVLSLFYARGAGQRGTTRKILLGQYLGFGGILLAAVVISLGARSFLPEDALPYFGLIPLALGLYAAWRAWRKDRKSTRLNSSHVKISYAVFCLKKKICTKDRRRTR